MKPRMWQFTWSMDQRQNRTDPNGASWSDVPDTCPPLVWPTHPFHRLQARREGASVIATGVGPASTTSSSVARTRGFIVICAIGQGLWSPSNTFQIPEPSPCRATASSVNLTDLELPLRPTSSSGCGMGFPCRRGICWSFLVATSPLGTMPRPKSKLPYCRESKWPGRRF